MTNRESIKVFNKWMDRKDAYQADPSCDGNCFSCEYYASAEEEKEAMQMAISALEKQEQDGWIPVTKRLPENKKKVLVSYDTEDGKKVDISMFDRYGCMLGLADAWRSLPEPYQEEDNE